MRGASSAVAWKDSATFATQTCCTLQTVGTFDPVAAGVAWLSSHLSSDFKSGVPAGLKEKQQQQQQRNLKY